MDHDGIRFLRRRHHIPLYPLHHCNHSFSFFAGFESAACAATGGSSHVFTACANTFRAYFLIHGTEAFRIRISCVFSFSSRFGNPFCQLS